MTAGRPGDRSRLARGAAAAAGGRHPQDQLGEVEGLAQIVVGAELEAAYPVVDGGGGGEHEHHRGVGAVGQRAAHLVTGDPGKVPVEDHDVVVVHVELVQRGRAVVGEVDGHAGVAQAVRDVR